MAIKLNGVEITSNKLNGSNVTLENLDGVKVWPTEAPVLKWQFVAEYSSEQHNEDIKIYQNINGQYRQGFKYLDINCPVFEFYEVTFSDYNQMNVKVDVTVPEYADEIDVMNAFITQHSQWYEMYVNGNWGYAMNNLALRADEDGLGNTFWKLRPTGNYYEGFVAVISDLSTQNYFEYVVVAI